MQKDTKYYLELLKTSPDGDPFEVKVQKFDRLASTLLIASLSALIGLVVIYSAKREE